eukprot:TRINITY_DN11144_c0_g1_i1.p1 TRINITY_DN11144_c0_g1~~TRINITY_DN11144_c0_g1_i1.p1  ORF type:complete len:251 (+),score=59.65 TRINITY_DN11144_c0_g1_i1:43-795(+)
MFFKLLQRTVLSAGSPLVRSHATTTARSPFLQPSQRRVSLWRSFSVEAPKPSLSQGPLKSVSATRQRKRLWLIVGGVSVAASAVFAGLKIFEENIMFYYTPTQLLEKNPPVPSTKIVRLGGLVVENSISMKKGTLEIEFDVTDLEHVIHVKYSGILPDLFREGQSVVAEGFMKSDGFFYARQVLAKHDEKYMPKDIKAQIEKKKELGEFVDNMKHNPSGSEAAPSLSQNSSAPTQNLPPSGSVTIELRRS